MAAAIVTSSLTKRFPGVTAVDGLTIDVEPGEIFGLVGPDGAGKSTTLRMLAGVLSPDSGTASVAGFDIVREPESAKAHLSYMPQRFGLYEDLTVGENIRFYSDVFDVPRADREQRAAHLLEAAGMKPFTGRLAGQLSGGMKQKLGLVCALIHRPRVILLDEPTNGVDPVSRRDFWGILYGLLDEGIAILMSTAYLDEAERCHRVALLHQGRVLFSDTPSRLKTRIGGTVLSIVSSNPRAVRTELDGADGVINALLVGDGVHLVVDDGGRRMPELQTRLRQAGIPFDRLEPVPPTIEDLFVAATSRDAGRPA
ncbi:MAG TPA: ABC transporter ATP-binding protein [Nitrospira sp.]|nr:ABC transporter ATP-binding protein [Nitrospira sp.]